MLGSGLKIFLNVRFLSDCCIVELYNKTWKGDIWKVWILLVVIASSTFQRTLSASNWTNSIGKYTRGKELDSAFQIGACYFGIS